MLVLVDQDSPQGQGGLPEGQYGTGGNGGGENTQTTGNQTQSYTSNGFFQS